MKWVHDKKIINGNFLLGTELNEDTEGAHFHLYAQSNLKIGDIRKHLDAFSLQYEPDKSDAKSVNSATSISRTNFRHQAGYGAKEHLKPWPTLLRGPLFVSYDTTVDLPDPENYIKDYFGKPDPHHFPAKLIKSRNDRELPLRWHLGFKQWLEANKRRTKQHKLQQKKAHGLGAERDKVNEFDLVSDISRLVFDEKIKLVTKGGSYSFNVTMEGMVIALKQAKLPSGQMKFKKLRDIYPDAKCEVLARLIPEDAPQEEPPEFKMLEFTNDYDDIVTSFKEQFKDPSNARYKFLVIAGDSRTGKSVFAQALFKNPFVMNSGFNFANFQPGVHDGIVLNDIRDIATKVSEYRCLFQSAGTSTLGDSRTNCYAIQVDTTRTPICVTINKESQFEILKKLEWVRQNSFLIDCADRKMHVEDEEDEQTRLKRERHEIDVLRWDHGPDAERVYHEQKRRRTEGGFDSEFTSDTL